MKQIFKNLYQYPWPVFAQGKVLLFSMSYLIWAIIVIWALSRIVNVVAAASRKKRATHFNKSHTDHRTGSQKKHRNPLDNEGEYVDFEEVK